MQRINDFQSIIGRDLFQTIAVVQLSSNTRSINSSAKHSFFSNFRRYKVTKPLKAIIETVRRGPNYVNKKRFHYSRLINISLHTRSVDLLPVQPVGATRLASARGGSRSKFRAPTFECKFFLKHMCIEESTRKYLWHCWDFSPPPAVIRRLPQWFGVPIVTPRSGDLTSLDTPSLRPWVQPSGKSEVPEPNHLPNPEVFAWSQCGF